MKFKEKDLADLKQAVDLLEFPSLAVKITDAIGMPIEKAFEFLPKKWSEKVGEITNLALRKALDISIITMDLAQKSRAQKGLHKLLGGVSGGVGGAFGFAALAAELPISTTIMLRSIADIARAEGEDLHELESRLSCLMVFALGGKSKTDDSAETGYFAVRASLSKVITEATKYIAENGLKAKGAPILIELITKIASRFSIQVTEKAASQAVPLIGAVGGATINVIFIDHFQNMAWGHFTVRRLEKAYGNEVIRKEYKRILEVIKNKQ